MWRNAYDTYLEERVLSADPVELVHMLYQAAIASVGDARRHLAERRIADRAKAISKACAILMELNTSLDHERGGEFSVRLSQLYGYMHGRLVEANRRQIEEPLDEVAGLLDTLSESWSGVKAGLEETKPRETPWMYAIPAEPEISHFAVSF
jgi:flagellar secretion chaperone FliS